VSLYFGNENPHKVVGHPMISSNKRVDVRERVFKKVLLSFLLPANLNVYECGYNLELWYKLST